MAIIKRFELHDRYTEWQVAKDERNCPKLSHLVLITILLFILAAVLKH